MSQPDDINQDVSISNEQEKLMGKEDEFFTSNIIGSGPTSTENLNMDEIISQVLNYYRNAFFGKTDISGNLTISGDAVISNNIDSQSITTNTITIDDGLIFLNEESDTLRETIGVIETTIVNMNLTISEISANMYRLDASNVKIDIFSDLSGKFYDLSNNFYLLNDNFTDLSGRLNALENKINDISFIFENFELSNNRILVKISMDISNLLITSNDFSYSYLETLDNSDNMVISLKQLNELLGTYNFSTVDNSSGIVVDISSSREYVNDISQTFYEIMTQQPHKFNSDGMATYANSSDILLEWNYDNIIARHDNSVFNAKLANSGNTKLAQLPYIDRLQIDICGSFDGITSSDWYDLSTINIPTDTSYNIDFYKQIIIVKPDNQDTSINQLLNNEYEFTIRVYGINNAYDYPSIENRSIIYEFLRFEIAKPPSEPIHNGEITTNNQREIVVTYFVNFTELNISNSSALIKQLDISYNFYDTLRSTYYNNDLDYSDKLDTETFTNLYEKDTDFQGKIRNGLLCGSRYQYRARVKNNLNDLSFSEYSILHLSDYTLLPTSSNYVTSVDMQISGNREFISNRDFTNQNKIYINLATNDSISMSNSVVQEIEITNPDATTSGTQMKGYGKFIDNSNELVSISVSIDDVLKQKVIYDGDFSPTADALNQYHNSNIFNFIGVLGNNINDMYGSSSVNKGFRLVGDFNLNNITNSDIVSSIGNASPSSYSLKYEYIRHVDVDNTHNSTITHDIYIDNLSNNPTINSLDISCLTTSVFYNMGIPSVKDFMFKFLRHYNDINSTNLFIPGNKIIAKIGSIANTSASQNKNITLANNADINGSGVYQYNFNQLESEVNSYYNSINYRTSILSTNYKLSWNETVYNLYNRNGNVYNDISFITNHYCDYNSFNLTNNKISSNKLNLSNVNLYEIDNIGLLGSDLFGLTLTQYTNHQTTVKDHTLLYIDGKFRSNSSQTYPNTYDFSYNGTGLNITDFSAGLISYDLNGQNTGSSNNGYKIIAFRILKSTNPQSPESYTFNNQNYDRISYDGKFYLSFKSMFQNFFTSTVLDNIFDETDDTAVAFCSVTLSDGLNSKRIGNFKQEYNPLGGDWITNGGINTSYNGTLNYEYGSKVENDNGDKGIYINPNSVNDDLTIYIGLKNN